MSTRMAGDKLDAAGFKDVFGLSGVSEGSAYSEGSSTGTKQVGALGTYMTEDDFKRLRNDDKIWDEYASQNGEEAMQKKREGNQDGLSINALDGLLDNLSLDAPAAAAEAAPESDTFTYSDKVAKAKANVEAFENTMLPNQGDYLFDRESTVAKDYADGYKLKLGEYQAPRNKSDGKLANPVNTQAQEEDEELAVAGSLTPFN